MRRKRIIAGVYLALCCLLAGCGAQQSSPQNEEIQEAPAPKIIQRDFGGADQEYLAAAVIYDAQSGEYNVYGQEDYKRRSSPCSTFKVVSTLLGLQQGIVSSAETQMDYDGTAYANPDWNRNLTLREAFETSCVWYYKKMVQQMDPGAVRESLQQLNYGNADCSEWDGSGLNGNDPSINGFWLESSLQISPLEQVDVLRQIIEGNTSFPAEHVSLLTDLMKTTQTADGKTVFGKTGTGAGQGWFIGWAQKEEQRWVFALRLADQSGKRISGMQAKEAAIQILENDS